MRRLITRSVALLLVVGMWSAVSAAPDFEVLARDTLAELSSGAFDKVAARFDGKMTAGLPREKLVAVWDGLVGQAGAFKSVTSARVFDVPAQSVHVVDLTAAFENAAIIVRVAFNSEGRIAGLFFLPPKTP